jgi:hypothetical protein
MAAAMFIQYLFQLLSLAITMQRSCGTKTEKEKKRLQVQARLCGAQAQAQAIPDACRLPTTNPSLDPPKPTESPMAGTAIDVSKETGKRQFTSNKVNADMLAIG